MDAKRFDSLTRTFSAIATRRGALGVLAAAVTAAGRAVREGPARAAPPACPKAAFRRCTKPAVEAFADAVAACRQPCKANPKGAACKRCVRPHAAALAAVGQECARRLCRPKPGAASSQDRADAAAAVPKCQKNELDTCNARKTRDAVICGVAAGAACVGSGGLGCAAGAAVCLAQLGTGIYDCVADFDCPGNNLVCVEGNGCCEAADAQLCGGSCCSAMQCQRCAGGTCVNTCQRPQVCRAGQCVCESGGEACNGSCCLLGEVCHPVTGRCCRSDGVCGDNCCTEFADEFVCCAGLCYPPEAAPFPCGDRCCTGNLQCCNGACWTSGPTLTPCGTEWCCDLTISTCCASHNRCCNLGQHCNAEGACTRE